MMVFDYYAATVLELFGRGDVGDLLKHPKRRHELDETGASMVEALAMSRQQFAVDPWLSWGLIEKVREDAALTPWEDLRPPLPSDPGAEGDDSAAGAAAATVG